MHSTDCMDVLGSWKGDGFAAFLLHFLDPIGDMPGVKQVYIFEEWDVNADLEQLAELVRPLLQQ